MIVSDLDEYREEYHQRWSDNWSYVAVVKRDDCGQFVAVKGYHTPAPIYEQRHFEIGASYAQSVADYVMPVLQAAEDIYDSPREDTDE